MRRRSSPPPQQASTPDAIANPSSDVSRSDVHLLQNFGEVHLGHSRLLRALEETLGLVLGLLLVATRILVRVHPRDKLLDRLLRAVLVLTGARLVGHFLDFLRRVATHPETEHEETAE